MLLNIAAIAVGFLLGSFPAAYVVTKWRKGVDIREVDHTGNVGAGAVFRQVGRWEGGLVAVADIGKGAAAVAIAQAMGIAQPWVLAASFAAVLGHSYPPYIGFRGGQGVDTVIGIFLVLSPIAMAIVLGILAVALYLTRDPFSMTIIGAPFLPLFIWVFYGVEMVFYYSLVIIAFIVFRSRGRLKGFRIKPDKHKGRQPPKAAESQQGAEMISTGESEMIAQDPPD